MARRARSPLIDVEIAIEPIEKAGARKWRVQVRSQKEGPITVPVDPLTDADLAAIAGLRPEDRTWGAFLRLLSPGSSLTPSSKVLRDVGELIMTRVLGSTNVARHLDRIEARAKQEKRSIRLLLEVIEDDDPILVRLPLELAYDRESFFFKRVAVPSLRSSPDPEARNVRLGPGSRVLIATAHANGQPSPDQASLAEHAEAIARGVHNAGFEPDHLPDATTTALRDRLLKGPRVDILYLACHGMEERKAMGQLVLRDKLLPGAELGRWLEEATELGRQVQVAILCACSSASPQIELGTSGMAQWLVRRNRALATLGFRGPVLVTWALSFSERLFVRLGEGASVEDAFSFARAREPDAEPQWPLALLYGHRRDLESLPMPVRPTAFESLSISEPPSLASPPLPRAPRHYFIGRAKELNELRTWVLAPGTAQITAVEGTGGIGKSELACVIAHEERATGRLVVWLERADHDVRGALGALVALRKPGFQAPVDAGEDDIAAMMRRDLGGYRGLLILDDIAERNVVDRLTPGGSWNVLVTTRVHGLLPGCLPVEISPLDPVDALRLLSRIAWDAEAPPDDERADAARLVERLGRLPLALELAGATLRNFVTSGEYLASLHLGEGVAVSDRDRIHATLTRLLVDLDTAAERAFLALGVLPAPGATGQMVATTLGEPVPPVTRRLDRLVRYNLATWSPELGRYMLHPLLRDAAHQRAQAHGDAWSELHGGAAEAIEALAQWVHAPISSQTGRAYERWAGVRDLFDSLDTNTWLARVPGADRIAMALVRANGFRADRTLAAREALLAQAERLSQGGAPWHRANVLLARGGLRRLRDDLEGAAKDFDDALALFTTVEDRQSQADVLQARGDLEFGRGNLPEARRWHEQALPMYRIINDSLGLSNVLAELAQVHAMQHDKVLAGKAASEAAAVAAKSSNAYAADLAARVLAWTKLQR